MPSIYLYLDGEQKGPYFPGQVRSMLAEGEVTAETPAWHEGLADWSSVGAVLAAQPAVSGPPPVPPSPMPRPARARKDELSGCAWFAIISAVMGFLGIFVMAVVAGVLVGPLTKGIERAKENVAYQSVKTIASAMNAYASTHNGMYPDGNTSTEVFQKLLDENYINDPGVFFIRMPGKVRATSRTLKAENVCFDVTSGGNTYSPRRLPLVFSTGYFMTYIGGTKVLPDPTDPPPFPGLAIAYRDMTSGFIPAAKDGSLDNVLPQHFPPHRTYTQLGDVQLPAMQDNYLQLKP